MKSMAILNEEWALKNGRMLSRDYIPISFENNKTGVIWKFTDITERILASDALKTSMDTLANAFNYSAIGIALISADGKWMDVNKVICDLTGYTKEQLLQLTYHDITYPRR